MFDPGAITGELRRNRDVFQVLLREIAVESRLWRPAPAKWNLLEIVCHLVDEECDDFRARVGHALATPEAPLPPIDPVGWVTERNYAGRSYDEVLGRFLDERDRSIEWLASLDNPRWERAYRHPQFGPMSARMFLANWLAHDYLHLRQIVRYRYGVLRQGSGEDLSYAGTW